MTRAVHTEAPGNRLLPGDAVAPSGVETATFATG
jgi:hypothetical protein